MSNQIVGRAKIRLGSGEILTKKGATFDPGGVKRNPEPSDSGKTFFSEETASPSLKCSVMPTADISLAELRDLKDATVIFEPDVGKSWMMVKAFVTEPPVMDVSGKSISLNLSAEYSEEV